MHEQAALNGAHGLLEHAVSVNIFAMRNLYAPKHCTRWYCTRWSHTSHCPSVLCHDVQTEHICPAGPTPGTASARRDQTEKERWTPLSERRSSSSPAPTPDTTQAPRPARLFSPSPLRVVESSQVGLISSGVCMSGRGGHTLRGVHKRNGVKSHSPRLEWR